MYDKLLRHQQSFRVTLHYLVTVYTMVINVLLSMQRFNVLKVLLWIKWQLCAFVGWNCGYFYDVYELYKKNCCGNIIVCLAFSSPVVCAWIKCFNIKIHCFSHLYCIVLKVNRCYFSVHDYLVGRPNEEAASSFRCGQQSVTSQLHLR